MKEVIYLLSQNAMEHTITPRDLQPYLIKIFGLCCQLHLTAEGNKVLFI